MILAVDFDGTVVDHRYPNVGPDVPDAVTSLRTLSELGHRLVLWTMRGGEELCAAVKWYEDRDIPLFGVNNTPGQEAWTVSPKAHADRYVDDAAVGCPLLELGGFKRRCVNWERVMEILRETPGWFPASVCPL